MRNKAKRTAKVHGKGRGGANAALHKPASRRATGHGRPVLIHVGGQRRSPFTDGTIPVKVRRPTRLEREAIKRAGLRDAETQQDLRELLTAAGRTLWLGEGEPPAEGFYVLPSESAHAVALRLIRILRGDVQAALAKTPAQVQQDADRAAQILDLCAAAGDARLAEDLVQGSLSAHETALGLLKDLHVRIRALEVQRDLMTPRPTTLEVGGHPNVINHPQRDALLLVLRVWDQLYCGSSTPNTIGARWWRQFVTHLELDLDLAAAAARHGLAEVKS